MDHNHRTKDQFKWQSLSPATFFTIITKKILKITSFDGQRTKKKKSLAWQFEHLIFIFESIVSDAHEDNDK